MAAARSIDMSNNSISEPHVEMSSIGHLSGPQSLEEKNGSDTRPLTPTGFNTPPVDEYPTGLRLVLLVGAVILSVFLISLDQVSCTICNLFTQTYSTQGVSRLSLARRYPKSRTNSMVWIKYPGMVPPTSCASAASSHRGAKPSSTSH